MEKFFDWLKSLPKAVQVMFFVAVFAILGFLVFKLGFGDLKAKEVDKEIESVRLDFPDAVEDVRTVSKLDELKKNDLMDNSSVNRYWNELAGGSDDTGGLVSGSESGSRSNAGVESNVYKGEYLDPTVYSEMEIYNIKKGFISKDEVDRQHRELEMIRQNNKQDLNNSRNRQEEADSIYLSRMERAYQLAQKYSGVPQSAEPAKTEPEPEAEPEPRKIDIQNTKSGSVSSASLLDDGIISSLDSDVLVAGSVVQDGEVITIPAKATFLKNETLISGQRVIMRLMQDLRLSDGTLIPANTHIAGVATVGKRLNIEIKTLNYGGRIYYADLDVYDNDGTEGIYCPTILTDKQKKKLVRDVGNTLGQVAGAVLSSNPYTGGFARSQVSNIMSSIDVNGNVTVTVAAGYEFYIFETVDKMKM